MNKGTLRTVLYIVLGLMIFSAVVTLFVNLLPYLLIGGLVIWAIVKIYTFFLNKKNNGTGTYSFKKDSYTNVDEFDDDSYNNGEVIDVDYKDVDE